MILAAVAAVTLAIGIVLEYRQRSESGPVALAPTLQYALGAALVAAFAVAFLRVAGSAWVAWWHPIVVFAVVLAVGGWMITAGSRRGEKRRR